MIEPDAVSQFARMIRWGGVFTSAFVILSSWIVLRLMNDFVDRISAQFATRRLLLQKLATVTQFIIYVGTGMTVIMLSFRIDERVLAVIGGTIAVSVGFAIKDLVASFIAGIMIMLDRPFQVGDRVSFGGEYGDITSIGLRSVRLQTLDDNTVTIPNNKFLSEITSNGNYGALDMQVAMTFDIGVDQDLAEAREIVTEAAVSSRFVHLPKPIVVHVGQMIHDSYVTMRLTLKAYVLDTKHEKSFQTDVNLRVFAAFRSRGILPPAVLHRGLPSADPAPVAVSARAS
ncbi:MAG: mechanosensitive ion channel domain-containing protein [Myxococcota bacterium]